MYMGKCVCMKVLICIGSSFQGNVVNAFSFAYQKVLHEDLRNRKEETRIVRVRFYQIIIIYFLCKEYHMTVCVVVGK